jgi:hypothetical protein
MLPPHIAYLREHQLKALGEMRNGCILYGGVGSGKSPTAVSYYMEKERPRDVYVITTAKKRDELDWATEFARYGVGTKADATIAGVLTVDSWNNISKYANVYGAFFIFDEQRLVGSGAWTKAFLKIAKRNHWILLSATPGDTWLDYIPVFVANGFYANRTEFKRTHVVYNTFSKFPKVDRYIGTGRLVRLRNELLVHMPYPRHTIRHLVDVPVEYDKEKFDKVWKDRWNVFKNVPIPDIAQTFHVARKVVNSDPSRLEKVKELLLKHPRLIVFYNFDYELDELRTLNSWSELSCTTITSIRNEPEKCHSMNTETGQPKDTRKTSGIKTKTVSSGNSVSTLTPISSAGSRSTQTSAEFLKVAEWNGHKHEPIPQTDRWVYLVQFVAGAEGWNCIDTDVTIFYSLPYSYKVFEQAHGRIDRLNTPFVDLYYYTLKSNALIDQAVAKTLAKKQSFNEKGFIRTLSDKIGPLGTYVG